MVMLIISSHLILNKLIFKDIMMVCLMISCYGILMKG